ncbi:hypothetical protein N7513_001935 [Penicillium frequentans]|nr:hypothetical protein N7513_004786 [Penicillium glabrum]KAJ5559536.1 hypothetical protein N7513_001935 [Penicillium glabrum]
MPPPRPGRAKTIVRFRLKEDFHYAQVWKNTKMPIRRKQQLQATERETVRREWMQRLRPMPHRCC